MSKWFLASCAAAALIASSASADSFNFTLTGLSGTVTGTFDGDLNGNLITNLSNISVYMGSVGLHGNGALFSSHYDTSSGSWQTGGGVASLDGSQNNFLFMDVNYPLDGNYTNFLYSVNDLDASYWANYNDNSFSYSRDWDFSVTRVQQGTGPQGGAVPEPANWALMLLGFGIVGGAMRGQRRVKVAIAA